MRGKGQQATQLQDERTAAETQDERNAAETQDERNAAETQDERTAALGLYIATSLMLTLTST